MTLEQVHHALAASSSCRDPLMETLYVAAARAAVDAIRRDLAAAEGLVAARERELVRQVEGANDG